MKRARPLAAIPLSLLTALTLSACNPMELAYDAQGLVIKMAFLEGCEGDGACESAIEAQFDACFDASEYRRVMDVPADQRESFIEDTVGAIVACIQEPGGEVDLEMSATLADS